MAYSVFAVLRTFCLYQPRCGCLTRISCAHFWNFYYICAYPVTLGPTIVHDLRGREGFLMCNSWTWATYLLKLNPTYYSFGKLLGFAVWAWFPYGFLLITPVFPLSMFSHLGSETDSSYKFTDKRKILKSIKYGNSGSKCSLYCCAVVLFL